MMTAEVQLLARTSAGPWSTERQSGQHPEANAGHIFDLLNHIVCDDGVMITVDAKLL